MLIAFAKNITLISEYDAGDTVWESDSQPIGEQNYLTVTFNVKSFPSHSNGTPTIEAQAQGSNDGVKFVNISGLTSGPLTLPGVAQDAGTVGFAYLRFQVTLANAGTTSGDWAGATFDIHGNLVSQ